VVDSGQAGGERVSNSVHLIGNVATEIKVERGKRADGEEWVKARFLLAVSRVAKRPADGQEPAPDWIPVEAWDAVARALAQYNGKGSKLGVTGRIRSEFYAPEGEKGVLKTAVVAERIDFLTPKPKAAADEVAVPVPASRGSVGASERRR
jgi:single-strand DNA-binding protein